MTREEAKKLVKVTLSSTYGLQFIEPIHEDIDEIYNDIEDYLKQQMNDQHRDFRDRCIFREVLEHIGGKENDD